MSITSSYVILFVILIRFLLKKAPKIYSYVLWSVAFLKLIFPFSLESIFSFNPINTNTIPKDIIYTQTPKIHSGITAIDGMVNNTLPAPVVGASVNPMQIWISIGQIIWVLGILALIIYSVFSTIKL
jgi:beta-lactamase regulating signal transducer with metallopeptidase domain